MREEFVMRGKTASGQTEVLNFSGFKPGMAYKMTEFSLYPSVPAGNETLLGTVVAGKTSMAPNAVDFNDDSLIASSMDASANVNDTQQKTIINDTFLITQNLILTVMETITSQAINWQCKFERVKMSGPQEAVTNYKQFAISDGS